MADDYDRDERDDRRDRDRRARYATTGRSRPPPPYRENTTKSKSGLGIGIAIVVGVIALIVVGIAFAPKPAVDCAADCNTAEKCKANAKCKDCTYCKANVTDPEQLARNKAAAAAMRSNIMTEFEKCRIPLNPGPQTDTICFNVTIDRVPDIYLATLPSLAPPPAK